MTLKPWHAADVPLTIKLKASQTGNALQVKNSDGDVVYAIGGTGGFKFDSLVPGTETYGSILGTGTTWVDFTTAGACGIKLLLANSSATGNFASLRIRARSDVATPTWNQNTIAGDFSASANVANYGELLGVSSYAQDNGKTQARVDHWSTAIKACTLCTATSTGSRYALVVSDYSTTKADTAQYLARFDKPAGACGIDGVFTFGNGDQFDYLARFEVTGGYLLNNDTQLRVLTPGAAVKYIQLSDVSNKLSFNSLTNPSTDAASVNGSLITAGTAGTWIAHSYSGACGIKLLLSNTHASGDFASLRIRARSNSAGPVTAGNFSASAGQNDFGNLYAVQGRAQAKAASSYTQASASNIVCGLYSCIDMAGATQAGRAWSTWIDTRTEKKAASDYLLRLSHNGTVASDGAVTVYSGGRLPLLFNFEDAVGGGFLTDADASKTTAAGAIAVATPAGTKYIVLYT